VALLLRQKGITRVRPLAGGFDHWRAMGFPVEKRSGSAPGSRPEGKSVEPARGAE
jgi:3-mercaptopyruvate sulfurtransferase SseA